MFTTLAIIAKLIEYETAHVTRARREIRAWEQAAHAIPDPMLRRLAIEAIAVDASNAEAASALAAVAPRRHRRAVVDLLVGFQILLDYVDMLGEEIAADRLERGLAIGTALTAAVTEPTSPVEIDPLGGDGGYLGALVASCRSRLWRLPGAAAIAQDAEAAAARLAHGLAHVHTAARHGTLDELRRWATMQHKTSDYSWWEIAAGSNSNLAILALLAAAADPQTTHRAALAIAAAYWPHVCVMSTLLDSLIDHERDATGENFSFIAHYPTVEATRDRVIDVTIRSLAAAEPLRCSAAHKMIVCGVAGYYAASAAEDGLASQVVPSLLQALRPAVTPIAIALRLQHGIGALRGAERAA